MAGRETPRTRMALMRHGQTCRLVLGICSLEGGGSDPIQSEPLQELAKVILEGASHDDILSDTDFWFAFYRFFSHPPQEGARQAKNVMRQGDEPKSGSQRTWTSWLRGEWVANPTHRIQWRLRAVRGAPACQSLVRQGSCCRCACTDRP